MKIPHLRFGLWIPVTALCALILGCAHTQSQSDTIVATWRDGSLTPNDLSQWQLFQPQANDQTLDEQCTDMAMVLFLANEAERDGVEPEESAIIEDGANRILANRLRRQISSEVEISSEMIEAAYSEHPKAFHTPPKVRLRNLFLHFPPKAPEADKNVVRSHMAGLRQRILNGEDFASLAEKESHSQTRFRQGLMGNVSEGVLPPNIDAVVMRMQPGETSHALETPEGLTLFHCDAVIDPRTPNPDEVRERLATNLRRIEDKRRWRDLKTQLADDAEISDSKFVPFAAEEARRRGLDIDPTVVTKTRWMTRQRLATLALKRRVERAFEPPPETEIRSFFESDRSAFTVPETFDLSVIRLDASEQPQEAARLAFALSYKLRHGVVDFAEIARSQSDDPSAPQGGRLEPMTRRQLAGRGPEFMKTATGLEIGNISREFSDNASWWILRLEGRHPRRLMTFDEAATQARSALAHRQVAALQESIETEIRAELDIEVFQ